MRELSTEKQKVEGEVGGRNIAEWIDDSRNLESEIVFLRGGTEMQM